MALNRMQFMNSYVDNVTKEEAIEYIEHCIKTRKIGHVITPNVDQIIRIERDSYFKEICDNAELLLVDGTPILWISRWYGRPIKEKICGSDLVPELCKVAAKKDIRVFYWGQPMGLLLRLQGIYRENIQG